MKTSEAIIAAARDQRLLQRITALAAAESDLPQAQIEAAAYRLVAVDIQGEDGKPTTISEAYAVAAEVRAEAVEKLPPEPGSVGGVPDDLINQALKALNLAAN